MGRDPRETEVLALADEVRLKIGRRAKAEGWLMSDSQGFGEAVQAKREEGDHFDLWWRGVVTNDDINELEARLRTRDGDRKESAGGVKRGPGRPRLDQSAKAKRK